MNPDYVQIAEMERMRAEMLINVLKDNDIPCVSYPVYGAGLTMKTGMQERFRILVPEEKQASANELLQELFSTGNEGSVRADRSKFSERSDTESSGVSKLKRLVPIVILFMMLFPVVLALIIAFFHVCDTLSFM